MPSYVTGLPHRIPPLHHKVTHHGSASCMLEQEPDIRFIRRMQRDIAERNRTADEVVAQYLATVRPMHELFVTPSKVRVTRREKVRTVCRDGCENREQM